MPAVKQQSMGRQKVAAYIAMAQRSDALMGAILASYLTVSPRSPEGAQQFVNGLHAALLVAAGITFAAAIVSVVLVRTRPQTERAHLAEMELAA